MHWLQAAAGYCRDVSQAVLYGKLTGTALQTATDKTNSLFDKPKTTTLQHQEIYKHRHSRHILTFEQMLIFPGNITHTTGHELLLLSHSCSKINSGLAVMAL